MESGTSGLRPASLSMAASPSADATANLARSQVARSQLMMSLLEDIAVPRLRNPASSLVAEMTPQVPASSEWRRLYHVALSEADPAKSLVRIAEARRAILDRIEDLLTSPHTAEHHALRNAFQFLCTLQGSIP